MSARRLLLGGALVLGVAGAGAVTASVLQDAPRDAQPVQQQPSADPIGDILRGTANPPAPRAAPTEAPPAATPAPKTPIAVTPPPTVVIAEDAAVEEKAEETAAAPPSEKAIEQPQTPARRQRRKFAVIQAIDKVTAQTMKFEVEVGGRPVRFNRDLIFSVRACEVSTPDELTEDSIAYVDVSLQPRTGQGAEQRQIFRGWMFASSPAVSGLQHPSYDAWIVGCKN